MNEQIKDYFYFTRSEKNGIIVLLIFIILLFSFPFIFDVILGNKHELNNKFKDEISLFSNSLKVSEEPEYHNRLDQYIIERYDSLKLFYFNPNNTSEQNFKLLGLTDKQINTIFNYKNKGGKFSVKDDFRKIYGMRQQQYQILKPYILLPDNQQNEYTNLPDKAIGKSQQKDSLFAFDPNKTSDYEFLKLGLSEKQIRTIRNYLQKGGKFSNKDEFRKIYGISEKQFNKLEPYLFLKKNESKSETITKKTILELNQASLEQLIEIKGIGNYLANEILKYRQKLGGYINKKQLLEIKSINPEIFEQIETGFYVNPENIKKLSLNFSELEDFSSHPYLNYYQSKEIVKYRSVKGPFKEKKELLDGKILLDNSYKKIEPYLKVN